MVIRHVAMEIREILSLTKLAENGSILKTAEQCHLSPGAVHKHLKSLESEFGVQLYEKRDGGLMLTPAGLLILPFLREALLQKEAASRALADWKRAPCGLIRIGAGPAFSGHILPPLLANFQHDFPLVEFYVETGHGDHMIDALREGTLDLVFDIGEPRQLSRELASVACWDAPLGFLSGNRDLPRSCVLADLAALPFVLFKTGTRISDAIQQYFETFDFQPRVVMRSDSAEALKSMIESELGVGILFLWSAQAELLNGKLAHIEVTDKPQLVSKMILVRKEMPYVPLAIQTFIERVRKMEWPYLTPLQAKPAAAAPRVR